ncbi:cytochrome P450 [Flavisphingomonas formosensis]|uniref:cytochrome P450 n=1 Tax=Flavisphingomonas formosensis TaxID=861534 RepID=UPI0012F8D12E|nr:cytochrome P450 [Sphingomonas formosensis]
MSETAATSSEAAAGCPFHRFLDFDTFAAGTPRAYLDELREGHRILWETDDHATGGHWLLFHQRDIDHVLQSPDLFTNNFGPILDDFPPALLAEQQESLTFMDPPRHRQYRALVDYAFRPAAMRAREPMMRALATDILDAVLPRGECEFVNEVAMQFPMRVIYAVLGVREEDFAYVADLTNTLTLADDPEFAENREAGFIASMKLMEFGAALAADHRVHPRESLTMDALGSEIEGRSLSDVEYGRFFNNLIVGGMETTRNTLAWAMVEFIRNPDQYALLQADAELVVGAVEEVLRFRNPVVYLRRTATRDQELAGQRIAKGDKVVCVLGSPNRDPAFFADPGRFDIRRAVPNTRRNYRTFGAGPHYCLGIQQARSNLTVMIGEMARRIHNPRLLAEPRHARSIFMDGFKELRIAFDAEER